MTSDLKRRGDGQRRDDFRPWLSPLLELQLMLTELSAPPLAAVPVRALAEHLRLGTGFADDGSQDAVLELYLRAAMAAIEARLGRALLARDYAFTVTRWREDASQGLPVGPVRSV